ncbi:MAG TPA: hypothetical protein VM686_17735 [Polyangiaceae bacterium]|nr:hypothetical protein [Polyangiaceae bacterium]
MTAAPGSVLTALCCAALAGGACTGREPETALKPTPPDMSALSAVYASPTGTFQRDSAQGPLDAARRALDQIATLRIDAALLDLVQDTAGAVANAGIEATDGDGYLETTRTCAGNGRLELTVGFSEQGIDAVAWGQAIACEYLIDGRSILLYGPSGAVAGDVRLSFGEVVAFDRVARQPVLLDLDTTAEVDGLPGPADLDFRVDPRAATLELRIPVDDGDVIVVSENERLSRVRARNGDFTL